MAEIPAEFRKEENPDTKREITTIPRLLFSVS
jgi:hypothetical protein